MNPAPAATLCSWISFFALSRAVSVHMGSYSSDAIQWLLVSVCSCAAAVFVPVGFAVEPAKRATPWVVSFGLAGSFATFFDTPPTVFTRINSYHTISPLFGGLLVGALLTGSFLSDKFAKLRLGALVGTFLFLACWVVSRSPDPQIDVYYWHRDALDALLHGHNPYAITIKNIYRDTRFYGPGVVENGRVMYGYPYLPASLLFSLPGHLLGDYRYSVAFAIAAAGWLIGRVGSPRSEIVAAAFLFAPKTLFVVEQGWTEGYLVFLIALAVYLSSTTGRASAIALGLAAATKQYAFVFIPFLKPLTPQGSLRKLGPQLALAAIVAAAGMAAFVLWDPHAFYRSVIELHLKQPFRMDSLSFSAALAGAGVGRPPAAMSFVICGGLVLYCALFKKSVRPLIAMALCAFAFFVFNKQAFANYYFLVLGLIALDIAAARQIQQTPEHSA